MRRSIVLAGLLAAGLARAAGNIPPDAEHAKEALGKSPRHGEWVDVKLADGRKIATWVVYRKRRKRPGR